MGIPCHVTRRRWSEIFVDVRKVVVVVVLSSIGTQRFWVVTGNPSWGSTLSLLLNEKRPWHTWIMTNNNFKLNGKMQFQLFLFDLLVNTS